MGGLYLRYSTNPSRPGSLPQFTDREPEPCRAPEYGIGRLQVENSDRDRAMNPYESPKTNTANVPDEISPAIVQRLIGGIGTEDFVFYDVSDHQLYGRKHRMRLTGETAKLATEAGCDTIVYQSVLWWCFVFIPIVPLGVFAVIPRHECDDPDGDADQYRGIRMDWDWTQIGLQYGIVVGAAALLAVIAYRLWFTS